MFFFLVSLIFSKFKKIPKRNSLSLRTQKPFEHKYYFDYPIRQYNPFNPPTAYANDIEIIDEEPTFAIYPYSIDQEEKFETNDLPTEEIIIEHILESPKYYYPESNFIPTEEIIIEKRLSNPEISSLELNDIETIDEEPTFAIYPYSIDQEEKFETNDLPTEEIIIENILESPKYYYPESNFIPSKKIIIKHPFSKPKLLSNTQFYSKKPSLKHYHLSK